MSNETSPRVPNPAIALPDDAARTIAGVLQALADPLRVRMVSYLASSADGRATVNDLAALTDLTQPTVSHHLRVLREAGIVRSEPEGTARWQEIDPSLSRNLAALFTAVLATSAERPHVALGHETSAHGLEDAHRSLEHVAVQLAGDFPAVDAELIHKVVFESYAALARSSRIGSHVVLLAERFARQRLEDIARTRAPDGRPQILFVCVQNAGRSQLAAAHARRHAGDAVVVRSAGSMPSAEIDDDVRTVLDEIGGSADAFPKPLTDDAVRAADVVITMGCSDTCPYYPGKRYEDWVVGDPAFASLEGVRAISADIDTRVQELLADILPAPHAVP